MANQSDSEDIYWAIKSIAVYLVEAVSKVPDFSAKVKTCVSLEGQRIRFISKDSRVIEIVAPWFRKRGE
jgi:hypothetical protein